MSTAHRSGSQEMRGSARYCHGSVWLWEGTSPPISVSSLEKGAATSTAPSLSSLWGWDSYSTPHPLPQQSGDRRGLNRCIKWD